MIHTEESIFEQAIQLENAHECATFLDQACANQPALRQKIESLLKAYSKGAFLESPVFGVNETVDMPRIQERPGSQIGRYKLLEQIGEGGMGIVYMAEQTEPVRRRVALKVVKPGMDTLQVLARFEAERQAIALMDHPNIARVHDGGSTETGRPFFVMELVRGMPITEYCDQVQLAPRRRMELFISVCQAVAHAHQKGIIHRDLKPSNILVTLHDGVPVPKVIDFGIAKAISAKLTEKTLFTGFGQILGTPLYMSPEQAEISGLDVDTRSDVYSLGVLLYELLTGQTPFDKDKLSKAGFDEMRRIILEDEPLRPSQRLSTVNALALSTLSLQRGIDERRLGQLLRGELDWIVMKALEKDRNRRYESVSAFAADVERYLKDEPVQACPPTLGYRFGKFVRRNRVAMVTAGLVSAALVLGIVLSLWQAVRAVRAEQLALQRLQQVSNEKQRADEERAIAVAVNDFIQNDLLAQAAPDENARATKVTVEEVLGRAAARISNKFKTQPQTEAAIRKTIGEAYHALGDYPAAQTHLERALELRRRVLGEEHSETLASMNLLAALYLDWGQYTKAEPILVDTLEMRRRVLGEDHPDTLTSLNNLAGLYGAQDQYTKAEPLHVKALELRRRVLGEEHPDTLESMGNLAYVYDCQGQHDRAEPLYVMTLELRRRVLGADHPNTLSSMNNLASLYQAQRQYAKAELLHIETLESCRRVLGEGHKNTLTAMNGLAMLYETQGQYAHAEPLYVKIVEGLRRIVGDEHSATLKFMNNLAELYAKQGQYAQAEPLYSELVMRFRANFGLVDPDTQAYIRNLAECYAGLQQPEKSEPLSRELIAFWKEQAGADSPQYAAELASFGLNLLKLEKFTEAEAIVRECLANREQKEPDSWKTFSVRSILGGSLLAQMKYADAEPLLLSGYQGMKDREAKIPAAGKHRLTEALERLVQLYDAWGQAEPAAKWRQEWEARIQTEKESGQLKEQL